MLICAQATTLWAMPVSKGRKKAKKRPTPPSQGLASVRISGVPHVLQKPDFCGEACVAMYAAVKGLDITQDAVFNANKNQLAAAPTFLLHRRND